MQLAILRGLPASGKTTWAENWRDSDYCKRVNKDDLRAMLDGGKYSLMNEAFICEAQHAIIRAALQDGYNVVVDDTNINPDKIQELIDIGNEHGAKVQVIDLDESLEVCIQRDAARPRPIGAARIRELDDRLKVVRGVALRGPVEVITYS